MNDHEFTSLKTCLQRVDERLQAEKDELSRLGTPSGDAKRQRETAHQAVLTMCELVGLVRSLLHRASKERQVKPQWWQSRTELLELASWLVEEEGATVESVLEMLEKPWNWSGERSKMLSQKANSEEVVLLNQLEESLGR